MRESDLLDHIYAFNAHLPARVTLGPGDDMGALTLDGRDLLVTVDQVADGLHFDLRFAPLEKIARKAITRNLSDVAAMAAVPVGAVAAACLPRDFGDARARRLFDLMRQVALSFDCPLIGGDISMWDHPLLLSVTVMAEPRGIEPVLRRGARAGDVVCVTGELGGSLLDDGGRVHHLDFEPRLTLARALAGDPVTRPQCMLDLSDGLARDLGRLCAAADGAAEALPAAGLAAEVYADQLPLRRALRASCDATQHTDSRAWPAWRHAVADGEDYELCFTLDAARAAALPAQILGVPITRVGRMVRRASIDAPRVVVITPEGTRHGADDLGWEHRGS